MKKHRLKNYLKFGILFFGILVFTIACQKDDEFISRIQTEADNHDHLHQENLPRGINVQTINFSIAPHKGQLIDKLTDITPQNTDGMSSFSENSDSSLLSGLNVEQDSVVFASFGNKHSYTFSTFRDYETPLLENLVLTFNNESSEDNNDYNAYLIQYDLENSEIHIHNVEDASSVVSFSESGCGWSITITPCTSGDHHSGNMGLWKNCIADNPPTLVMEYICEDGVSGGSFTLNSGNDYTYDGGTGNDNPPVDDNPNLGDGDVPDSGVDPNGPVGGNDTNNTTQDPDDLDDIDIVTITKKPTFNDPCKTLTDATNDTGINNAIDNLKTKVNEKQEYGYKIIYSYNTAEEEYQYNPIYTTSGENTEVDFPTGGHIQGFAHNHPKNGIAIPSWTDIHLIYKHESAPTIGINNNKAFNIIVAKDPENSDSTITYAITINNFTALESQINHEMSQPKVLKKQNFNDKLDKIMEKFEKKFENIQDDNDALQKKFLETFNNYGIDLYKKDDSSNTWKKLVIVNNSVTENPCNN